MNTIVDYCVISVGDKDSGYANSGKIRGLLQQGWVPFGGIGGGTQYEGFQAWVKYDKDAFTKLSEAEEKREEAEENLEDAAEKINIAEEMLAIMTNEMDMWKQRALKAEEEYAKSRKREYSI